MESIGGFLETKSKLKVNKNKSAVDRPWKRKFLQLLGSGELETVVTGGSAVGGTSEKQSKSRT